MAAERIVVNTGPLIAFARAGVLETIGALPIEFLSPEEVRAELDVGAERGHPTIAPPWLRWEQLRTPLRAATLAALDPAEAAVIELAMERGIATVAIDELEGRRVATATGLHVVGTAAS